ncbi:glycoside hydrolase family 3 protein [Halosimplex sp. J119]
MIVEQYVKMMTPREKVGQLLMAKPYTSEDGTLGDPDRRVILDLQVGTVGGPVIGSTDRSPEELLVYLDQVQELAKSTRLAVPPLVNADFEHGVGQKCTDATEFPQAMGIGATRSTAAARSAAEITAREAKSLGVHWNNAPIADVNTEPENPIIGWRSFADDAELVGDMVAAQVEGYQSEGVVATACHFPGHGAAADDSHTDLPYIECSRRELEAAHLPPFARAVDAGVESVMTGHLLVDALDPDRPASLSPAVYDLLRDDLGFEGVAVTDSLDMEAITDEWTIEEAALEAIRAGADVAMTLCSFDKLVDVRDRLVDALETGTLSTERVNEAVRRVLRLKLSHNHLRTPRPSAERVTDGHLNPDGRATANRLAGRTITLASDDGVLPLAEKDGSALVVGFQHESIAQAVADHVSETCTVYEREDATDLPEADRIIVSADGDDEILAAVGDRDAPVIVFESGAPYDAVAYRDLADAVLFLYDTTFSWALDKNDAVRRAAVAVTFGRTPEGRLPVHIDDEWPFGHGLTYEDGEIVPLPMDDTDSAPK